MLPRFNFSDLEFVLNYPELSVNTFTDEQLVEATIKSLSHSCLLYEEYIAIGLVFQVPRMRVVYCYLHDSETVCYAIFNCR